MSLPKGPYPVRDTVVRVVCNFLLKHVASPWYEGMIKGLITLGMEKAKEDSNGK